MINDLDTNAQHGKYVDDSTVSEVEAKSGVSHAQAMASRVEEWSRENGAQLNVSAKNSGSPLPKSKESLFLSW